MFLIHKRGTRYHLILHFGANSVIYFIAAGIINLFQLFSAQHEQESVGRAVSDLYSTHTKHTHARTHTARVLDQVVTADATGQVSSH